MAVVQISKIQIRRDVKDASADSSLPIKLSDGEFAWCRDTKQLYIGSAIVGAPGQLENVEILTQYSDIFSLGRYQYKSNGVYRSFVKRLEDRVSVNDFGLLEGDIADNTSRNNTLITSAIQKLFLNTSLDAKSVLEFGPGIYVFNETIQIPSYTKIRGAGKGNTVIKFLGSGTVFEFIEDPNSSNIEITNQCRYVKIEDLTIEIPRPNPVTTVYTQNESIALSLYGARNCEFRNIEIKGPLLRGSILVDSIPSKAISVDKLRFKTVGLNQVPKLLGNFTYSNTNIFDNITIRDFQYGLYSDRPMNKNTIVNCSLYGLVEGIHLGVNSQSLGPNDNIIRSCTFDDIQKHAVKVERGTGNICSGNQFLNVGNNFGGAPNSTFGQVEFDTPGNINLDYISYRHNDLSFFGPNSLNTRPYVSEFTGYGYNVSSTAYVKTIDYSENPVDFIRFPLPISVTPGIGPESMSIEIDYLYQSRTFDPNANNPALFNQSRRIRKGTITVLVDFRTNTANIPFINLVDDYDYIGYGITSPATVTNEDINLIFRVKNVINSIQNQRQIILTYQHSQIDVNRRPYETGKFTYTYRVLT
ncbi:MAG: hypothetical protein EBS49_02500 [Verrucomicrobia bacterium]|nr:hypothetical protein [Verrucomicrobiota bacterium]